MASSRARPALTLRALLAGVSVCGALAFGGVAHAAKNDLQLLNLCELPPGATECPWIHRANGLITSAVLPTPDGQALFRSLMSELGVVIAPRLQTPADTLGYAGFQFSAELGITTINNNRKVSNDPTGIAYWNGLEGVSAGNPNAARPSSSLTTVGGFVRKGLWF